MGKVRAPNPEQKLAIEHQGGVLLKAGAGSGKTFVLVEHIIYLTELWITEYLEKRPGAFEEFIRKKFSSVVMMTFTKKAAGEMNVRLNERFEGAHEDHPELWASALENLPLLTVTTIDGFCRKLITSGYFPHLSTEAKVIFNPERTDQVRLLVEEWFEARSSALDPEMLDIILREKKSLLTAFTEIFNDPGLRLAWKTFRPESIHPDKLDPLLSSSFDLQDLSTSLHKILSLEIPDEKSAFETLVSSFQATGLPEVRSVEKLSFYAELFRPIKSIRGEATAKKKSPLHDAAKEGLVELRDWVETWDEVVSDYRAHFKTKVFPWVLVCQEIFQWIDQRLDPNQGLTFGDIEYEVALGLRKAEVRSRIQRDYQYFIVDEFQDTSALQFEIIRELIGSDFSRLFCVGDAKQAIYGFRGGELSVFQDCEKLVPKVLSLANNYRSLPNVIAFNNSLFRKLLPLGQGYEGHDPFTVRPEDQNVPLELTFEESGKIEMISAVLERNLEEEGKFSNEEINRIEAELISQSIEEERTLHPENVCTVLYTKLKPSHELIKSLMDKKIGFTAQFKSDLLDDPVSGMFLCLLGRQFDQDTSTRDRYPLFVISSVLDILNLPNAVDVGLLRKFDLDVKYWGLLEAFRKFLHELRITNENADINLEQIETLAELYHQDPEAILSELTGSDTQRVSLELRFGDRSHMVQIMTAHASKGLEFETVYLGGIYTNGREQADTGLFGQLPGSFNWFIDLQERRKQKSPFYVFENELAKYKSFSEGKRLFYVAATRAKANLKWVELGIPEKCFSIPANSWIDGMRKWFAENATTVSVKNCGTVTAKAQTTPKLPLYFHDNNGVFAKSGPRTELLIAAELSVTRLNALMDCPRKFYLANVLKLTEPSQKPRPQDDHEELEVVVRSSSERGTFIHAQIAQGIVRNFVVPREIFGGELHPPVEWALETLRPFRETHDLIPEKGLKFELFNFMISGIPDLVLLPKAKARAQIWDFKTGRITQDNLNHYWLQLSAYAYALYTLGKISREDEIELVLCFVDQKKTLSLSVSSAKVSSDLYELWRSQNEPWKTNPEHCGQCAYGTICPR